MQSVDNPFFAPSDLPYALPPFDRISEEHYLPAFRRGMAEQRAEVAAIAAEPEPPTFDNTLVALERTGRLLERVSAVFFNQASSDTNPVVEQMQEEMAPELAAHSDAIHLDPRVVRPHRRRSTTTATGSGSTRVAVAARALPHRFRPGRRAARTGRPGPAP